MKKFLVLITLAAILIGINGCKKNKNAVTRNADGKLIVTAVNFPPFDFVRRIAKDKVNIKLLLPPGAESHSFEPSPRDIITVQNSSLFIYVGGESESWVERILETMDTSKMIIIKMMDLVDAVEEEIVEGMEAEDEEEETAYDEHVWTSPQNAILIVKAINTALCEADPGNADFYGKNTDVYIEDLARLDAAFKAVVKGAKRKTIIFADRFPFRYFADAYGLKYFAAFPGCSTETEPSVATVAFLIDKVKAEKIPVVFHIELSNERMADTICGETGAKKLLFHACHNISKKDFDAGLGYLDLMRVNVENLKEALW
jgi:zinc transport system substrate-binding protein